MYMACRTHGEEGITCIILVGRQERKRSLTGPRYKWENNIKMNFIGI
jgi:hypothetical protein